MPTQTLSLTLVVLARNVLGSMLTGILRLLSWACIWLDGLRGDTQLERCLAAAVRITAAAVGRHDKLGLGPDDTVLVIREPKGGGMLGCQLRNKRGQFWLMRT